MPQTGVGSMQGKSTGNMPSAACVSSMDKSLDPTPIPNFSFLPCLEVAYIFFNKTN